jgi:hypothetical protein
MKRILGSVAIMLTVMGCAGMQTVSKYNYVQPEQVDVNGKCFQVRVLPPVLDSSTTAYVDICPAASFATSYIEGLTLGLLDTTPSKEKHEEALRQYFKNNSRDCEVQPPYSSYISDGMGGSLGYEVRFECKI